MQPCREDPAGTVAAVAVPAAVLQADVNEVADAAYCENVPFTPVMMVWLSRLKASAESCRYMLAWMGDVAGDSQIHIVVAGSINTVASDLRRTARSRRARAGADRTTIDIAVSAKAGACT